MTNTYWETRKRFRYYQVAIEMAKKYSPYGSAVLDVGSRDCEYITLLDSFVVKHAIDLKRTPAADGIVGIKMDFMQFVPDRVYDLVLCLQVLEHVSEPESFCAKLMETGKCVIISVPYMWREGTCATHLHDPIDEAKLLTWTGKPWKEMRVITDRHLKRMVAAC